MLLDKVIVRFSSLGLLTKLGYQAKYGTIYNVDISSAHFDYRISIVNHI